jgi:hypothetical protein
MAHDVDTLVGLIGHPVDDGREILELPLDRVRPTPDRVGRGTPAAAIDGEEGMATGQQGRSGTPRRMVSRCPVDEDERRTFAGLEDGNRCAIGRPDPDHRLRRAWPVVWASACGHVSECQT